MFIGLMVASQGNSAHKFHPRVEAVSVKGRYADLLVNGRVAFEFRTSVRKMQPAERATTSADRLTYALGQGLGIKDVHTESAGRGARVKIGDTVLAVITVAEARAHGVTAISLAQTWIRNLHTQLSMPPLSAKPQSLLIPLGETRSLTVQSLLPDTITVSVNSPAVAVDNNSESPELKITALAVGVSVVKIACGPFSIEVPVTVKKYAAYRTPNTPTVVVTGMNLSRRLLDRILTSTAYKGFALSPGAHVGGINFPNEFRAPTNTKSSIAEVSVEASGSDYIDADLPVNVEVENRWLPLNDPSRILYSNDPERLKKFQMLYSGHTDPGQTQRLLYHHQNMMRQKAGFVVDLVNTSGEYASVHLIEGISDPLVDTFDVGYRAGLEFLKSRRSGAGWIVDIPPMSRRILVSQSLGHLFTASGVLDIHQLDGSPLLIRVVARPDDLRAQEDPSDQNVPLHGIAVDELQFSDRTYPDPNKRLEMSYTIGGNWAFRKFGDAALKNGSSEHRLYGNYGVIYEIKATIINPLPTNASADIVFESTAGTASGVFFINGKESRVKHLGASDEAVIGRLMVPAGGRVAESIVTMPLSGSFYPATIIIRKHEGK
jgi:hypothetical protein